MTTTFVGSPDLDTKKSEAVVLSQKHNKSLYLIVMAKAQLEELSLTKQEYVARSDTLINELRGFTFDMKVR